MFKNLTKNLTKNLWIKIFCLFAATVLWVYIAAGQSTVGKYPGSIKIKAINAPSGLVAVYDVKTVDIKIMAEPSIWSKLSGDSFSAFVDLSGQKEGTYELPVNVVSSVAGVSIVEKNPEKIIVSLEPIVSKEVTINKKVEGNAGEGLVAGNIELSPDKTIIRGPKSIINNITEATAIIKLNGETEKFSKSISVTALDDKGEIVDNVGFDPVEVTATIPIVKASNNKTVGVRVKTVGTPKTGFYVSGIVATPSTVDITGSVSLLSEVQFIETSTIDLTNLSDTIDKDVSLNIKSGLALQAGSVNKVHVKISFKQNESSKEITAAINTVNLNSLYKISSIDPAEVQVICSGPSDVISNLSSKNVLLNLDFQDKRLSDGNVTFNLNFSNFKVPDGVSVISFVPSSITVKVDKK